MIALPSFVLIYAANHLLSTIKELNKIIFAYYIKLDCSKPRDPPILLHTYIYVEYNVLSYDEIHWYGHSLVLKMRNHNSGSRNQDGCQLVFSASLNGLMNRL